MSNYVQTTLFGPKDTLPSGSPAKLIVGAQFDTEYGNIATAIATKYDATLISASPVAFAAGNASLPSITFIGGTNSNTGMYLSAANTLGFSAGGVAQGSVNNTGGWNLAAPTGTSGGSNATLTVNGISNAFGQIGISMPNVNANVAFTAAQFLNNNTGSSALLQANIGASSGYLTFGCTGSGFSGTNGFNGASGQFGFIGTAAASIPFELLSGGQTMVLLSNTATSPIKGYGPTAAGLVDLTPDTGTFTGAITGCTAGVNTTCTWTRVGNLVILSLGAGTGTSNATTMTMTGLPTAIQPARTQFIPIALENNSANALGVATISAASGTITFANGVAGGAFTAAGVKGMTNTVVYYLLN